MTQRKGETLEEFKARESAYKKMAYERKKAEKAAAEAELHRCRCQHSCRRKRRYVWYNPLPCR